MPKHGLKRTSTGILFTFETTEDPSYKRYRKCYICEEQFLRASRKSKRQHCYREACEKEHGKRLFKRRNLTKTKECTVCGRTFRPAGRDVTCSKRCSAINRAEIRRRSVEKHRTPKPITHTACVECGTLFEKDRNKKTCSEACRTERKRRRSREQRAKATPEEKAQRHAELREDRRILSKDDSRNKHCKHCGVEYHPLLGNRWNFCSEDCRTAYRKEYIKTQRKRRQQRQQPRKRSD